MQLLRITTVPMKYEMQITRPQLDYTLDSVPNADVEIKPAELDLHSKNIEVRLNTYQARRSIGYGTIGDRIKDAAQKGMDSVREVMREDVEMGAQMARIEDGVTIPQVIRQKMQEMPQMYTAFLPSTGAEISWQPNELRTDYKAGSTTYDWKLSQPKFTYSPGSVHFEITQYAKVNIEYLGRPLYIPKSADPEYVEPET